MLRPSTWSASTKQSNAARSTELSLRLTDTAVWLFSLGANITLTIEGSANLVLSCNCCFANLASFHAAHNTVCDNRCKACIQNIMRLI